MKLSKHFYRVEFKCRCGKCDFDTVDAGLIEVLEIVRETYGEVRINSGARCEAHNKAVGGGSRSQHLYGKAADIVVDDVSAKVIYDFLDREYPDTFGIGLYKNPARVHIDVRTKKARW